jgi:DNA-binding MarR family transcriptional regulator
MTVDAPSDMLAELGYLCLGSRLKRAAERLQADAALILRNAGFEFQPGQFNLLAVLDRHGPSSVSQIVAALGLSQPAITRSLAGLIQLGLVETTTQAKDGRLKVIGLTQQGAETFNCARAAVWPRLEKVVREMCTPLSGSLLNQLGQLESAMAAAPLIDRFIGGAK